MHNQNDKEMGTVPNASTFFMLQMSIMFMLGVNKSFYQQNQVHVSGHWCWRDHMDRVV